MCSKSPLTQAVLGLGVKSVLPPLVVNGTWGQVVASVPRNINIHVMRGGCWRSGMSLYMSCCPLSPCTYCHPFPNLKETLQA